MMPPEERPTAQELADASRGGNWECPKCGCKHTEVRKTWYLKDGTRRRSRVCRNCGQAATITSEVEVPKGFKLVVVEKDEEERACA